MIKTRNNMEQFTKNFSYDELIASATAKRLGLDNTPSEEEKEKLRQLAEDILQPIRDAWRAPIVVTSGFRSEAVNKAVGGVKNSQHRLGEAADITIGGKERNRKLFNFIYKLINQGKIKVGQLIDEYNYSWVHISLPRKNKPNNQILHLK
jgi:uncharacterized protein YcbK (DUF882 family)